MLVKVSPRGQITIPKSYRESLNISPGDTLSITEAEGQLYLRPFSETIFDMRGIIQVDEPQNLEIVLETTKIIVAHQIVESENELPLKPVKETIFDFFGSIPPADSSNDEEDFRAEAREERAEKVTRTD